MTKKEMEMMMKMFAMMNSNDNGNGKGKGGNTTKKHRGAMELYELQSEYNEKLYHEIAEEFGCLFTAKNGKKFVGATYENGVEKYSRKENIARVYREMDARNGKVKAEPKSEEKVGKLEDMSKEELIAMIKSLI